MKNVRTFDLFCGGGGSSIGAARAGAIPVGGADMWSIATDAFGLNLPGTRTYTENLLDLTPDRVAADLGRIDLLLASPECTHHSVAKGNKPRSEDSKRLAFQVIRFAEVLQPRWIVVENVMQMERWEPFKEWMQQLHALGYHTLVRKFNADTFGVAQTRRRLFIICDRKTEPVLPTPSQGPAKTIGEAMARAQHRGDWSYRFTPLNNGRRAASTLARANRAIEAVGKSSEFIMVYYGSDGAGGFQTLDRPLRTITTLDRFALVRPNCVGHEMRMLQPSELAAAMGFPASYRFPPSATRRDCIKLIGNAVCPPVMRSIVKSLLKS